MAGSPYDPNDPSRALAKLQEELAKMRARVDTLLANDRKRQDAPATKPASRSADERAAGRRGITVTKDVETKSAAQGVTEARTSQKTATDALAASEGRLARAQALSASTLRLNIQQGYASSQELRRRGALTTEAIAAAARGTLTFRELGYQVGSTIGKFAGWTLAAGFTFAAIDAVQKLGQGALQGAEGVNKLTRVINNVDTSRAHDQIRSLAESANQDLATVGEGLFESGKVFNNQDDAEKLTRVALRAKNIGELEVGDAVRFLTSVVRGFKLEASDASSVLDIFNNLQQKFGTDIRGGLQGGAQAAAQVLNSGGNLRQMAALIATIQRAGFSGSEAGVAIRRSTELIKRPGSINKERLAAFGIDSEQPYAKIIEQAVALAESGKVKGPKINELATALVTPQLSPRFAAILNRPDQYRRAFEIAGPVSSKDSAKQEEQKFLSTPLQQLKAIGVELEKLGDAIGESGALKPLALMAKALETSLEAATQLVNAFNELPKPLRTALLVAAELYAVTRLIRRFNPGDGGITPGRLPTQKYPSGFFQPSQDARLRKFLKGDTRNEVQYFRDTQESASRRQTDTEFRRGIAVQENAKVRSADLVAAKRGDPEALRRVIASDNEALHASQAAARAKIDYVAANKGLTEATKRQAQADQLLSRRSVYTAHGAARQLGFQTVSSSQDIPTHIQPGFITPGGIEVPGYVGQSKAERTPVSAGKEAVQKSRQVRSQLTAAAREGRAFALAGRTIIPAQSAFGRAMAVTAVSAGQIRAGAANARSKIPAARAGLAGAARGLTGIGASLAAFVGPLELLILAAIAIPQVLQALSARGDLESQLQAAQNKTPSVLKANELLEKAKQPRDPFTFGYDKARSFTDDALGAVFGGGAGRAAKDVGLAPDDPHDEDIKEAEQVKKDAKKRQFKRRILQNQIRAQRAAERASRGSEGYNAATYDDAALQQEIEALNTLGSLGRLGRRGVRDLTKAYIEALGRFAGSRDPKDIEKLSAAQQGFEGGIGSIQENLEQQLEAAGDNQGAQRAALQGARAQALQVRQVARANLAEAKRQQKAENTRLRRQSDDRRELAQEQRNSNQVLGGDLGQLPNAEAQARSRRQKAKQKVSQATRALREIEKFLQEFLQSLAKALSGTDRFSKFDEQTDLIRQRAEVTASGTLNTGAQLSARLNAANQNLSRARSLGNGPEAERRINDAIIERNGILNEFANLAVQQLEATNAIAVASAPTEQARIKAELSGAQQKLSLLQSQGRGPEETNVVIADIIRLKKELNRQILEDANALAEASAEYAKSLTGSDVKEANIDVRLADKLLANARKIEDPTERRTEVLKARARRNDARGSRTLTGFTDRFETIEYKARIGLISGGQELNLIQNLLRSISKKQLRTIDGMREFYRSLKERMKALEKESELEINPASIRLPTLYDVRRLQQQGTNQANAGVVQQQNVYTFDVGDVNSAEALGGVLERIHGSNTTAAMRAAGII